MAIENRRGCGYRRVGALYLVGPSPEDECVKMPYELHNCPVCSAGIKFSRGFTWIQAQEYFDFACSECDGECPFGEMTVGLMWVGERYYSPESFVQEAISIDISKRLSTIPNHLNMNDTWVLLAHRKAIENSQDGSRLCEDCDLFGKDKCPLKKGNGDENGQQTSLADGVSRDCFIESKPGLFYAFKPKGIEMMIWESDNLAMTEKERKRYERRGITLIVVPDGDKDHAPRKKSKKTALLSREDEGPQNGSLDAIAEKE